MEFLEATTVIFIPMSKLPNKDSYVGIAYKDTMFVKSVYNVKHV